MKIYKTDSGILINKNDSFYLLENEDWDSFVNDDDLLAKAEKVIRSRNPIEDAKSFIENELQPPIQNQEIWASGVTYYNSKLGRQEESKEAGGGDFYARVYVADRPELFFKSNRHRCVGSGEEVRIRKDSTWDVPEPELTLVITSNQKIVGYTIGNDMSSRSIEGENPLYLPQAKSYDGSAAVGPCIYVTDEPLPESTKVEIEIIRNGEDIFSDEIGIDQIKREFEELVGYLYRECSFPFGSLLMTGTGIVPGKDFTLQAGDEIQITIQPIGILINKVAS
ncbi:MAG: fumarylacetoacetate hydrolase family protein [Balneolaceae bacterium]|nr:fumarylacetoacetate hydrolase family protein [Balneolaceae bacterium]